MPGWSDKVERHDEHRTDHAIERSTGHSPTSLDMCSREELETRAAALGIEGRGRMSMRELITAIRASQ